MPYFKFKIGLLVLVSFCHLWVIDSQKITIIHIKSNASVGFGTRRWNFEKNNDKIKLSTN